MTVTCDQNLKLEVCGKDWWPELEARTHVWDLRPELEASNLWQGHVART